MVWSPQSRIYLLLLSFRLLFPSPPLKWTGTRSSSVWGTNWIPLRFHLTYCRNGDSSTQWIYAGAKNWVLFNIKQINFAIIELRFNKCSPLNRFHLAGFTQSQLTTQQSQPQPQPLLLSAKSSPKSRIHLAKSFTIPATIHGSRRRRRRVVGCCWWQQHT